MRPNNDITRSPADVLGQPLNVGDIIVYAERPGHADLWRPHLCFAVICGFDRERGRINVLVKKDGVSQIFDGVHSLKWLADQNDTVRIDECHLTDELKEMMKAWRQWKEA